MRGHNVRCRYAAAGPKRHVGASSPLRVVPLPIRAETAPCGGKRAHVHFGGVSLSPPPCPRKADQNNNEDPHASTTLIRPNETPRNPRLPSFLPAQAPEAFSCFMFHDFMILPRMKSKSQNRGIYYALSGHIYVTLPLLTRRAAAAILVFIHYNYAETSGSNQRGTSLRCCVR